MSDIKTSGSKLNPARAEIRARREGRELLIRGVLHHRRSATPINVDELTAVIAQALREALK
jgi:hypothetical protein